MNRRQLKKLNRTKRIRKEANIRKDKSRAGRADRITEKKRK